ncbi:MAG: hypothetical protein KA314_05075 [Chloroflexi bacterium]|nr:hypothetical protein [Chloroflexota bacterium]
MAKRKQVPDELLLADEQIVIPESTSGGEEPEVNSEQLAMSSEPEPLSPQPLVLSPVVARPRMTEQVFVKCVASQAVLDSQVMLQGEVRVVAYGLYRQAWSRNAAAFQVRLPGSGEYVQETE